LVAGGEALKDGRRAAVASGGAPARECPAALACRDPPPPHQHHTHTRPPRVEQLGPDGKPKKKSRVEEHSSDEEHGDFDPQQLREHEEFTKASGFSFFLGGGCTHDRPARFGAAPRGATQHATNRHAGTRPTPRSHPIVQAGARYRTRSHPAAPKHTHIHPSVLPSPTPHPPTPPKPQVKNIDVIQLGQHEMHTWYFSPFPPEYNGCKKLFFCEYRRGGWGVCVLCVRVRVRVCVCVCVRVCDCLSVPAQSVCKKLFFCEYRRGGGCVHIHVCVCVRACV
jgi:hypothetical protein